MYRKEKEKEEDERRKNKHEGIFKILTKGQRNFLQ